MIVLKSLKLWVILHFDVGFIFIFILLEGRRNWTKGITLGRDRWRGVKLAPPSPGGSLTQGLDTGALRVTRKSSLLNSVRILENFCTVISSELLFRLLKREKLTQRL